MSAKVKELRSIEDLDATIAESGERPVLLFKHSRTCPISARAYREFREYLESAAPNVSHALITVQTDRPVSNEAADRLGVRHETPQAILIRDGRQVWNDSHFAITAAKLREVTGSL